jgi:hypothetical protein
MNSTGTEDEKALRAVVRQLENENRELRERLGNLSRRRTKVAGFAIGLASRWLLGPSLANSIKHWSRAKTLSNPLPLDETSELAAAVIRRFTRIGLVGLLIAILPIALLAWQNRLIRIQIDQQAEDARIARRAELIDTIYSLECPPPAEAGEGEEEGVLFAKGPGEDGCRPRTHIRARSEAALAFIKIERGQSRSPDLSNAPLSRSNFSGADLSSVAMGSADLGWSNLAHGNLHGAFLSGADLRFALLFAADLREANLSMANLARANLKRTNLRGANLGSADLRNADLSRSLGLSQEQIDRACCDSTTRLPTDLLLPPPRLDSGDNQPFPHPCELTDSRWRTSQWMAEQSRRSGN